MASQAAPPEADPQALQQRIATLTRLVEVSRVMSSTLQLDPLLEVIMHAAEEITGSEGASILLVEPRTGDLQFMAATGQVGQELIGMRVPLEGSIAGTIIAEGRAIIVDDVSHDPRHYREVDEKVAFETRSVLGVPMRMRGQLVGVLELVNKAGGEYGEDDLENIETLASMAAVTIENSRLVGSLERAYAEVSKLDKLKTDFIAVASHELRTPLGIILGYAAVLRDDADNEMRAYADALYNASLKMRTLVEGMTNLRYLQLDEGEMHLEPVSLASMQRTAYDEVYDLAAAQDHIFICEEPAEDALIVADRAKAVMAITNVLNNAIKFTPPGGVVILSAGRHGREGWITVRDNGYGIPQEETERIFEPFYQVEDPLTRRHGGLGIGLAITRAVMQRHRGRVWAESPGPGEGSRFTLAFPLAG